MTQVLHLIGTEDGTIILGEPERARTRAGESFWVRPVVAGPYKGQHMVGNILLTMNYTLGDFVTLDRNRTVRRVEHRKHVPVLFRYNTSFEAARDFLIANGAVAVEGLVEGILGATFPLTFRKQTIAAMYDQLNG